MAEKRGPERFLGLRRPSNGGSNPIWVTPEERARAIHAAEVLGCSISELARAAIRHSLIEHLSHRV